MIVTPDIEKALRAYEKANECAEIAETLGKPAWQLTNEARSVLGDGEKMLSKLQRIAIGSGNRTDALVFGAYQQAIRQFGKRRLDNQDPTLLQCRAMFERLGFTLLIKSYEGLKTPHSYYLASPTHQPSEPLYRIRIIPE